MPAGSAPPESATRAPSPVSRARIERTTVRTVAAFGLVFGAQTVPSALSQSSYLSSPADLVLAGVVFGSLLAFAVSAGLYRAPRFFAALVVVAVPLAVLAWPLLAAHPGSSLPERPWLWYLLTVATTCAALLLPLWWAALYTVGLPVAFGAVRTFPIGGGASGREAALDASYAIILGGVILIMITLLLQASDSVDTAQSTALERYATAVRQHATESERVQVDAIVHDSVLTTLLTAAAATTPDARERSARMAGEAIGHLRAAGEAEPGDRTALPLERLCERLREAASAFSSRFHVEQRDVAGVSVPVQAAEALYSATVQAMVNSMQHAGTGGVERRLRVSGVDGGVSVVVADTGRGFDAGRVPIERLGLRVSIRERMAGVGGVARVDSRPGGGTSVALDWRPGGAAA